jgi:hypothetical protein
LICPYCFEVKEPAPSIFREGPCSPLHCIRTACCLECPECSDWFIAIEPEEGKVAHPRAVRPPIKRGPEAQGKVALATATKKKPPEGDIPW